ncbi:glycosyltransferase [Clostridium sp. MCC353]|uniref:glycosyltransferase n=1 Tax=Clostridium sp. MCC353 TaxID=2592646 RepID=UPI001C019B6A|nr:glycosyltransferase [Clostridium sp. MCC353]
MKNKEGGLASIIVPIYKVEKYLRKCINSILLQTYRNIEIILVDDGSPDACGAICDEYRQIDSRITVVHKVNGGLSDARNEGLKYSHGEYIFFVDSDDWLDADYCNAAIYDLESNNADVVVFGYNKVNEENNLVEVCCALMPQYLSKVEALRGLIEGKIDNYAWNKAYRKKVFNGIKYPIGMLWEDIGTTYRVFEQCEAIYIANRVTYNYLIRKGGITGMHSFKADIDIFIQRKDQYNFLKDRYPDMAMMALPVLVDSAIQAYIHIPEKQEYLDILKKVEAFLLNNKRDICVLCRNKTKIAVFYTNHKMFRRIARLALNYRRKQSVMISFNQLMTKSISKITRVVKQVNSKGDINKLWKDSRNKIYIIGTPDHDNLGDHAIALSTQQFLEEHFSNYEVIDVTEEEYWKYRDSLIKRVNTKKDLIVLQGGGNLGNQYMYIENIRRDVIKHIEAVQFLFPQTMFFTETAKGYKELEKTEKLYGQNANLTLFARERKSFEMMKRSFPNNKVYLIPDIVLRYRIPEIKNDRNGILLCLRHDKESALGLTQRADIKRKCLKYCSDIRYTDTCVRSCITKTERIGAVNQKLTQFENSKVVVTDRLHGMVFAALTKTPCIVLANYNHKIHGVYEWISNLDYIQYLNNISQFDSAIKELINYCKRKEYSYSLIDYECIKIIECMQDG